MEEYFYEKTGYLNSDFKLFHITDQTKKEFRFHYHDFHKILILLRGNISYAIEGKQYDLKPEDIILVRAGEIHRPIIHDDSVYERIILYLSPEFFEKYKADGCDLFCCFEQSLAHRSGLIRISDSSVSELPILFPALIDSCRSQAYGSGLYQRIKIIEFLILLNRTLLQNRLEYADALTANPLVQKILAYINEHICDDSLSIDDIAQASYLNRSYLMHLFKEETGCTIGKYITEKRLFLARGYIAKGMSVTDACYRCGFKNYTAFYYAWKNKYGSAPTRDAKPQPPTEKSL